MDNWVTIKTAGQKRFLNQEFSTFELRLFLIGLIAKLLCGSILASAFLTDLFLPFLNAFIEKPWENPYSIFVEADKGNAFPYPATTLFLFTFILWPITALAPELFIVELLAIRLVLLLADLSVYLTLRSWLAPSRHKRLVLLYWLNPITFYISYVHGQLDVISIAFLIISMAFLFSRRLILSAAFFGLALAAKTSVALIAPVYILYFIQQKRTWLNSTKFFSIVFAVFVFINLPFFFDPAFFEMVFQNEEQSKVLTLSLQMGELSVYWFLVALTAISALGLKIGITNPNLFIIFTGFFFSSVLVLIPPMHGWYYWIIPFFSYFHAREKDSSPYLFLGMMALYFTYFLVSPKSDYLQVFQLFFSQRPELGTLYNYLQTLGLDKDLIQNIIFTFLQTSLFLLCVQVLRTGLLRYRLERISGKPFLLGVGGNSGVGKTNLAESIEAMFGEGMTTSLRGDDRHKWQRGSKEWKEYTHLNPKANFLHQEVETLRALKRGKKVWRRSYDHGTGTFTRYLPIVPRRLMVLEGLHPFFLGDQRRLFDLRIFIEPDFELANHWKICRDRQKRDYTVDQVLSQIQLREQDLQKYIASQKPFADIVISPKADRTILPLGEENAEFEIEYDISLKNSFDIDNEVMLLSELQGISIKHLYEDAERQRITLSGKLGLKDSQFLLDKLSSLLQEVEVQKARLPLGLYGAVVFIACSVILKEAKNV